MLQIQRNIPLKNYTSFKIGGLADFFCEIYTKEDLGDCFHYVKNKKLPFFYLGNGSNLLVNDLGFRGIVLKLCNKKVAWQKNCSTAEVGILLSELINSACARGWGGLEWAYGIRATLGGAIRNNAGAFGSAMSDSVVAVEIFDIAKEKFFTLPNKKCKFSYHKSIFHQKPGWIIWQAILDWRKTNRETVHNKINSRLKERVDKQPLEYPSAGSFFRNPSIKNLKKAKKKLIIENFIKKELSKAKRGENLKELAVKIKIRIDSSNSLPAGYFIERAGLKGKRIGGAEISKKHANFIVNTGKAKAEDIIILASIVKQKVRQKFGVQLREEVEYVGF